MIFVIVMTFINIVPKIIVQTLLSNCYGRMIMVIIEIF